MVHQLINPIESWNIEKSDIILSILEAGSFTNLMSGSHALYKET